MQLVMFACAAAANGAPPDVVPLENAHAHNDYEHARPLLDALDQGFTSVEADVFPVAGNLIVAHDFIALRPERTLEALYLAPLADRVKQNGGHVYPAASRFFLLVDIKANAAESYRLLQPLLSKYSKVLTVVKNGKRREGAITVVLTGDRPKLDPNDTRPCFVGLDGRLSDLDSRGSAHFMPMISDKWESHFHWDGHGPMPESERSKLQKIVNKAHEAGRVVRFWGTPENETLWRELRADRVDLINTDQLERLAAFLKSSPSPGAGGTARERL